ncbi:MAG: beta-propeller domain-containing protein, partial [Clostridia bacterium]|nr:beta-propeller domain-containing protein [Clostridia bacterium]
MKKNTRFLCLILSLSILFGIFTVACAPNDEPIDPNKDPVTVNNPVTDPTPSNKKDGNFGTFSGDEELLEFVKENCEMIFTITTDDLWIEEEAVVESAPMDGANGADFEEEAFEEPDVIVNVPASNPTGESDDFSLDEDMFVTPETEKGKEVEVSDTNLVEENVDEGDILKTDGEYIYILRNNELIIVSAKEKNSEVLS